MVPGSNPEASIRVLHSYGLLSDAISSWDYIFLFLISEDDGVRLSPLGTSATNWPIVPVPDDR
jgi:hypothetical protein